jgi:hypothetical protein
MPHDVYQVPKHDYHDQALVTPYALGTQRSLWPQVCQAQFLEFYEGEGKISELLEVWEPNQSVGASGPSTYLRERFKEVLSEYNPVVNELWRKLQVVAKERPQSQQLQKNQAAIRLLRSWRTGDEEEQQETLAYLKQVLDEDRLSDRKLFP